MKFLFWFVAALMIILVFSPIVLCYLCPTFTGYSMQELSELMWTDEEITDREMENTMIYAMITVHLGIAIVTCLSLLMRSIIGTLGSVGVTVWIYLLFGKLWTVFVALGVGIFIVILPFIISIIMCFFSDGDLIKIASDIVAAIGGFAIIGLIYMIGSMFDSTHWFIITLNILYCILGIICVVLTFGRATDSMDDYSALLEVQMAVGISRALNRNVSTDYGRNLDNFNEKRDQELLNTLKSIEDED